MAVVMAPSRTQCGVSRLTVDTPYAPHVLTVLDRIADGQEAGNPESTVCSSADGSRWPVHPLIMYW